MSAPPRLTDDPAIPETLRSDLRNAAETEARPFDVNRGLESLRASLGGLPVPSAPPPSSGLGPTFWGITGVGTAAVIGAILAGGYYYLSAHDSAAPMAAPPLAARVESAVEAPIVEEAPLVEEAPPPPVEAVAAPAAPSAIAAPVTRPRHAREIEPRTVAEAAPAPPIVAQTPEDPDALLRLEMAQLARIRMLLSGDPAEALRLAEEGHRRFAGGMFSEEREALAVLSLSRLGRAEARSRGAAFLRQHPRGPFSEEIRRLVARP